MALWDPQLLAQIQRAAATVADTPVIKTVQGDTGWFNTITGIASGLMSVAILVLTIFLVPAAYNFRNSYKKVNDLLDRIYGDVNPIVRHVSTISDNVDYITTSIRVDIQQVNQTIAEANQRLNHALALSEQRLNEFNALLQVVQREAEGAFVSTASTMRGMRAGAAHFRREALGPPAADVADLAAEDLAADDLADDLDVQALDQELEQELDDGNDDPPAPDDRVAAPRIRPRGRGRSTS